MDPLSQVLSLLKPISSAAAGFDAGGEWAVRFPAFNGIKFNAVVMGQCWLSVEGLEEPVLLSQGDCFLLPSGRPFCLASALTVDPVDSSLIFPTARYGGTATWNGGGEFFLIGSRFSLAGDHADLLLTVLAPVVHVRQQADQSTLRWCLQRMMEELRVPQPGGTLLTQHLAHIMLVQILRLHLNSDSNDRGGWLSALADKQLGDAITAMHDDPAHRWTLQELAMKVGMSRSSFALKFKGIVTTSPMEYLTRWRMFLASDRLVHSSDSVSVISYSLGYESEAAFSTAFKRTMGSSPRQYGRERRMFGNAEGQADRKLAEK